MRAACGWERGRSGQGKYNEEACRSGEVSAWGGGADGCGREAGRARRCGKEGAQSTGRGRWLRAGGWRGQAPEATRMCGGSNHRRITAEERQSANGGEGGSKTCGRHVDGSGADNLTIAAVCAVGRGLDAPLLLVIVPVYFFSEGNLLFFFIQACLGRRRLA